MNRPRLKTESYKAYKANLKQEDVKNKAKLNGKLIWNSASIVEEEIPSKTREKLGLAPLKIKVKRVVQGTYTK